VSRASANLHDRAVEGRVSALFSRRAIRDRFRRAPWAFAFSLLVLLVAAISLYLLKIEMIPREAAWLPSLVFVIFLGPARFLTGWAYARSGRRDRPRHWIFRVLGRLAIVPAAALYVLIVFLAQYTSWGGVSSLYEQHAFLLPVPFLNM
jgi:cytochrome bd-type quinol oxidase subunit 1